MLAFCISNVHWGFFDAYSSDNIGSLGAGFTVLLLLKYGREERPAAFYSEKYLKAFPMLVDECSGSAFSSPQLEAERCYISRSFYRILNAFGLVSIILGSKFSGNLFISGSIALRSIFSLAPHRVLH